MNTPSSSHAATGSSRAGNAGIFAAIASMCIWGMLPVYWILVENVPPYLILCHRIVWCCAFIVPITIFCRCFHTVIAVLKNWRILRILLLSSCTLACNWLIFIWAVLQNRVIEVSLGYYINPLISVFLGVLVFRETPRRLQWAAIAIAGAGVGYQIYALGFTPWVALGLGMSFGIYGMLKKLAPVESLPGLAVETLILLPPALAIVIWSFLHGYSFLSPGTLTQDLALLGTGIITTVPLALFSYGVQHTSLTTIGLIQYIGPSITFLLGLFVFHERLDMARTVSFTCIWLALLLYTLDSLRAARPVKKTAQ